MEDIFVQSQSREGLLSMISKSQVIEEKTVKFDLYKEYIKTGSFVQLMS